MNRLLVIEDDDFAYAIVSDLLNEIGYGEDIVERCHHIAGLEHVQAEGIGIILTDLTLPDSVFSDTFEKVAKKFPHVPVIVLTGTAEIDLAINTIKQGAQDYLLKNELDGKILKKAIQYAVERKRITDKVFVERQNLSSIINNTTDIIWSIDRQFNVISANNAYWNRIFAITGKRKHDLTAADFERSLYTEWIDYFKRAFKGEQYKLIWEDVKDGKTIYEELSFNPVWDKNNIIIGISCFSRDITDQQTYLSKIERQNEKLRKIAWTQSHEVRSPVARILGLAELLDFSSPVDPDNRIIIGYIKQSAYQLDNVIRKIVSYAEAPED